MRSTRSASLPAGGGTLRRLLRRNLTALLGLALLAGIAAVAASLATWAVDDPSLSYATDRPPRNALGLPGAIAADLVMQFFGLAGIVLLLPPVVWAWRLVFGKPNAVGRRQVLWWLAATAAAALAGAVPTVFGTWPLPTGMGGVVGDFLLAVPSFVLGGPPAGLMAAALTAAALVGTAVATLLACGFWPPGRDPGAVAPPRAAPAPRIMAPAAREEAAYDVAGNGDVAAHAGDEAEGGGRLSVVFGALAHWGLTLGSAFRRHRARAWPEPRRRPQIAAEEAFADWEWSEPGAGLGTAEPEPAAEEPPPPPPARAAAARPKPRAGRRPVREAERGAVRRDAFDLPPLDLLAEPRPDRKASVNPDVLEQNARLLEGVLEDFGVRGEIINVRPGPVVTLYELEPAPGIKSARVIGLADDIARSMSAISCRVAVIPGKNAIGIELPNPRRETVYLRELLASGDFDKSKARLGLCLGKTIGGEPVIADLTRMPHLLVAGTTGSGKSVSINTMILSLLYRLTPDQCRMIMIDPKMLELSTYDGIPHLLTPVVTDPKRAVIALKWTVREMEDRYRKMSKLGVRNIDGFNARLAQAAAKGETLLRTVQTGFDRESGEAIYEQEELRLEPMPYMVVIIDEMADLMMVAGKDIEGAVQRLAQMARAAGIHVVMATQRPSVDVITGTIKANFPTRISFQVTSKIDSRTILGEQGAEQLLGQGDMLYMAGGGRIQRVHGPFVSDEEVEDVVAHLKLQGVPEYLEAITAGDDEDDAAGFEALAAGDGESSDLYDRAVAIVLRDRKASTSYIQRRLSIGYNRAASIIERMEHEGLVGPANHAGKREILVGEDDEAAVR